MTTQPAPLEPIRRFDVFAEYSKLKWLKSGHPLDEAKGYGLWLAKVVASRRFRSSAGTKASDDHGPEEKPDRSRTTPNPEERFRSLDDKPQTDALFDREIVARMGPDFYEEVFVPAIANAFAKGQDYVAIRDTIRKSWKPAAPGSRRDPVQAAT
jgi:hypothetical protein